MKLSACFILAAGLLASVFAAGSGNGQQLQRRQGLLDPHRRAVAELDPRREEGPASHARRGGHKRPSAPSRGRGRTSPHHSSTHHSSEHRAPAPAHKQPQHKSPAPHSHTPAPAPVPAPAPAPVAGPGVPLSPIQQVQLAAITEYAQNALVEQGTQMWSAADFAAAGFKADTYPRITMLLGWNSDYGALYQKYLGANYPGRCTYNFPVGSLQDFVEMSRIVEQAAHLARFQPVVRPLLNLNENVPPTEYRLNNNVLHNTIAQYIVSCPSSFVNGMTLLPPPVLAPVPNQVAKLGSPYTFNVPAGVNLPASGAYFYIVSGDIASIQNAVEKNGQVTVVLPEQKTTSGKGMTYVSIVNSPQLGGYSGPSDQNIYTATVPVNAIGETCQGPTYVC